VVVNEMLAAGLPVIAVGSADIGIDRSYLREGATGFFLDSLDENALAGIMTKLLRDRESVEKMRQNLLANQMEYSWSTVLKGYLDGDCA
jgi:glycosyltransferase involved in cell wall biosynthesis